MTFWTDVAGFCFAALVIPLTLLHLWAFVYPRGNISERLHPPPPPPPSIDPAERALILRRIRAVEGVLLQAPQAQSGQPHPFEDVELVTTVGPGSQPRKWLLTPDDRNFSRESASKVELPPVRGAGYEPSASSGEPTGVAHCLQIHSPKEIAKSKDYVNQAGLSRHAIFTAVEASLVRLDTTYLDLLQIHRFDASVPIEETMEALHDLVKSGKVRYIGASSMWATQFAQMQFVAEKHGWTKFISMQNHYNLLYREEEREMNRYCNDTGVGLIPWAPLCRGHLARPHTEYGNTTRSKGEKENALSSGLSETDIAIIKRVQETAEKKDWKMSHVALAWIDKRI